MVLIPSLNLSKSLVSTHGLALGPITLVPMCLNETPISPDERPDPWSLYLVLTSHKNLGSSDSRVMLLDLISSPKLPKNLVSSNRIFILQPYIWSPIPPKPSLSRCGKKVQFLVLIPSANLSKSLVTPHGGI